MSSSLEEMRKRMEAKRKQLELQQQQQQQQQTTAVCVAESGGAQGESESKAAPTAVELNTNGVTSATAITAGSTTNAAVLAPTLPNELSEANAAARTPPPTSAALPQAFPTTSAAAAATTEENPPNNANDDDAPGGTAPPAENAQHQQRKRPRAPPFEFQSPPDAPLEYHSRDVTREPQTSATVALRFLQSSTVKQVAQRFIQRIEEAKRANDISWSRKKAKISKTDDSQSRRGVTNNDSGSTKGRERGGEEDAETTGSCFAPPEPTRSGKDDDTMPPPCRSVEAFLPEGKLSEGVYGIVFRGRCAETGQLFALKQIKAQWLTESQIGFPGYLLRELDLTLNLAHPNIIRTREIVFRRDNDEALRKKKRAEDRQRGALEELELEAERDEFDDLLLLSDVTASTTATSVSKSGGGAAAAATGAATMTSSNRRADGVVPKPTTTSAAATGPSPKPYSLSVYAVMDFAWRDLKNFLYERRTPFVHLSRRNVHPDAVTAYVARVKCIAKQIFSGLSFLHRHSILHRDLKTSNVLVTSDGTAKICDLGLARFFRRRELLTPTVVTLMYRAPELHFGILDYDASLDIWSAGCILAEMFLKAPLFRAETEIEHCARVCRILGYPTNEAFSGLFRLRQAVEVLTEAVDTPCAPIEGGSSAPVGDDWASHRKSRLAECFYSDKASTYRGAKSLTPMGLDLLERIFQWNPRDRPTADEVLAHPFFTRELPLPADKSELTKPMPFATAQQTGIKTESAAASPSAVGAAGVSSSAALLSSSVSGVPHALAATTAEDDARLELEDELEQEAQLQGVRDTSPPKADARRRMLAVDDEASRVVSPSAPL